MLAMHRLRLLNDSVGLLAVAVVAACAACGRRHLDGAGTGGNGMIGTGTGGGAIGGGAGGDSTVAPPPPCAGASDPRMVVASQRVVLLTLHEIVNTVRYLIDDTEANALLAAGAYGIPADAEMHFPPSDGTDRNASDTNIQILDNIASDVGDYVTANFGTLAHALAPSSCAAVTDDCASSYLNALAVKAYRRQLTPDERSHLTANYQTLRSQMVNGYLVEMTVEEAAGYVVGALLMSPQLVWRWEIGGAQASPAPPGVPLTADELASALSFFLTDGPPDQPLLDAARAGTLTPETIGPHADRLLATQAARDWLRKTMEIYFLLNQLPYVALDSRLFPDFSSALVADMQTESRKFLDFTLWNGTITDLLASRTTFLNSTLASTVYNVPIPPGATATNFVQVTLPSDQRSGILTNPGFITSASRADGNDIISLGRRINYAFVGFVAPPPAPDLTETTPPNVASQSPEQQAAYRISEPKCAVCHAHFDPYGLALERYNAFGRIRSVDEQGRPIDARATLPPEVGGKVNGAVELATALARSPAFTDRLASAMLQYGVTELSSWVERPSLPGEAPRAACAAQDLIRRFQGRPARTFAALIHDIATSPAFGYRQQVQ